MKTIDFSYFIERYNTGEMDTMEKKWFMKELEGNTRLQQEVDLRKRVDDSLVKHDLIDLRQKLASLEKSRKEKAVAVEGKKTPIIKFAAAIAVLMLLGTLYLINKGSGDPDKLYNNNFAHYVYSGVPRTGTSTPEPDSDISFRSAMDLYNSGNYIATSAALRDYLRKNPQNTEASFILGVSEMENNNIKDAIRIFQDLCSNRSNLYLDHSRWYLALCYVKTEANLKAKDQLEAIINSGSIYESKARKIARKIK